MTETLTLTRPDDWHIHLRDGQALTTTVADAARSFARVIVMPNLVPPITQAQQVLDYRARIMESVPGGVSFEPLMVLYLTDNTSVEQITAARQAGVVACKLYPAGATTNSDSGVTDITRIYPVLEAMQKHKMLLLIHGEVTSSDIDIFDREAVFIERTLGPLIQEFPGLKIVLEHITTAQAVEFVAQGPANIAATITAHHLLYNRNHMLAGGIRPHYYCLPILKRQTHQQALIGAAISGSPKFFLGTDSAPHAKDRKEAACGCAGSYTAFAAIELYAEAFETAGALDKLEGFASHFGSDFYGLPRNEETITLVKKPWQVPETLSFGDTTLVPVKAGETLCWQRQS
ncbi:dihydroorotase [Alteromonadaceae bacterium 2753L.S.0a.02]|nr:dihydroorotase [Alteromonadaceae bacterium 2753L.S.0a.02]